MGDKVYNRVYNRFKRVDGEVDTKSEAFQEALDREYEVSAKSLGKIHEHPPGVIPNTVIKEMLDTGLVIVGNPRTGKTNCAKVIASRIIRREVLKDLIVNTAIFDSAQNWRHNFESIPFQEVYAYTQFVHYKLNMLYDVDIADSDIIMERIGEYVKKHLRMFRHIKKLNGGKIESGGRKRWMIICIEEAQNIIGTHSLSGKTGKFWLTALSERGNFNTSFIFIGQRLADISTKAIERSSGYLFGRMTGDNDKLKVKRICGVEMGIHKQVGKLKQGEFIYWNGEEQHNLYFERYDSKGCKPFEIH